MPCGSSLWDKIFKRDEAEAAAFENLKPAVRSAVRALALTIQRMEREGKGPYDAPYSGLVEHPSLAKEQRNAKGNDEASLLILRQTALNLAIAAGRLDIASLMVGPEDEGLGEDAEKEEGLLCAATHLGWNPCFTTTDNEAVLKAAKREYPVLCCFLDQRSIFGTSALLPDGREPRSRLPATLTGWTRGSVTAITSLNALHRACFYNRLTIVRYLVEACGMCVDDPTLYGSSSARPVFSLFYPVHFATVTATWTGDLSVLRYLIEERKCEKDARVFGNSFLFPCDATQVISLASITSPAQTPLHLVCAFRESIVPPPRYEQEGARHPTHSRLVVRYLLRAGLDGLAETYTYAGETPFSLAVTSAKRRAEEKFFEYASTREDVNHRIWFASNRSPEERSKEVKWSMALVKTLLSRCPWMCPLSRAYPPTVFGQNHLDSVVSLACPALISRANMLIDMSEETIRDLQGKQPTELLELLLSFGAAPLSAEESMQLVHYTSPRHCQLMLDHGIELVGAMGMPRFA